MVLDDGCGLGTVTAEVKKSFPDLPVVVIDSSAGILEVIDYKAKELNWKNIVIKLLDGGDLTGTLILRDTFLTYTTPRLLFNPRNLWPISILTPITFTSLI